jgi:hypothetical protein
VAQIIGLHPNNLISPIDFVPGVGPALKIAKGVRYLNRARKTRKGKGVVNYINAFGDDLIGLSNIGGGYLLARATTIPLIAPAYKNRQMLLAFSPSGSATQKIDFFLDYLDIDE